MTEPMTDREVWAELAPLRRAVAGEFARPLMPSQQGLDDLVDRITLAVARYMNRVVLTGPGTVAPNGCPDCGAPVSETKHGRATLHLAGCRHPGDRGPKS